MTNRSNDGIFSRITSLFSRFNNLFIFRCVNICELPLHKSLENQIRYCVHLSTAHESNVWFIDA